MSIVSAASSARQPPHERLATWRVKVLETEEARQAEQVRKWQELSQYADEPRGLSGGASMIRWALLETRLQ